MNSRARSHGWRAAEPVERDYPELARKMHLRTAVVDWRSRALEIIAA